MSFTAKYYGRCFECDGQLRGEEVHFTDDGKLVHENCDAAAPVEQKTGEVCGTCFTVKSLTGECSNCD